MGHSALEKHLISDKILSKSESIALYRETGHIPGAYAKGLLALGIFNNKSLAHYIAQKGGFPLADKRTLSAPTPRAIREVDLPLLKELEVLPLKANDVELEVALLDPLDSETANQLRFFTGKRLKMHVAEGPDLYEAIERIVSTFEVSSSPFEALLALHQPTSAPGTSPVVETPVAEAPIQPEADTLDSHDIDDEIEADFGDDLDALGDFSDDDLKDIDSALSEMETSAPKAEPALDDFSDAEFDDDDVDLDHLSASEDMVSASDIEEISSFSMEEEEPAISASNEEASADGSIEDDLMDLGEFSDESDIPNLGDLEAAPAEETSSTDELDLGDLDAPSDVADDLFAAEDSKDEFNLGDVDESSASGDNILTTDDSAEDLELGDLDSSTTNTDDLLAATQQGDELDLGDLDTSADGDSDLLAPNSDEDELNLGELQGEDSAAESLDFSDSPLEENTDDPAGDLPNLDEDLELSEPSMGETTSESSDDLLDFGTDLDHAEPSVEDGASDPEEIPTEPNPSLELSDEGLDDMIPDVAAEVIVEEPDPLANDELLGDLEPTGESNSLGATDADQESPQDDLLDASLGGGVEIELESLEDKEDLIGDILGDDQSLSEIDKNLTTDESVVDEILDSQSDTSPSSKEIVSSAPPEASAKAEKMIQNALGKLNYAQTMASMWNSSEKALAKLADTLTKMGCPVGYFHSCSDSSPLITFGDDDHWAESYVDSLKESGESSEIVLGESTGETTAVHFVASDFIFVGQLPSPLAHSTPIKEGLTALMKQLAKTLGRSSDEA